MTRAEMDALGWDELDVLLVTGDAYIDHPSFGAPLLGRWLVHHGFRVGIVAQPRWDSVDDIRALGQPRLFTGITAGALDSMLAHYTAFRKKRSDDAYTPGGKAGARPNRATIVYTSLVRSAFKGLPVVVGGIEASLRRGTHYDFWSDKLRRSILLDSKADVLVYGMAEHTILEIAERLRDGEQLAGVPGTAWAAKAETSVPSGAEVMRLPPHEAIERDPGMLMKAALRMEEHMHRGTAWAVQDCGGRHIVYAPPAAPLSTPELDALYALPFTHMPHPKYTAPIPAYSMIRFSIAAHRGCGGGCSFCSLALHQGRRIQSRSAESIREETEQLTAHVDWDGSISDVGGPSANMWGGHCVADPSACRRRSCLTPELCPHFKAEQQDIAAMLSGVKTVPGVRNVRVASGIRHDLALTDKRYLRDLIGQYVGGQLKLAPEHCTSRVLELMRKPAFRKFTEFLEVFEAESRSSGKKQYIIPYLLSAFPGCTDADMRRLKEWLDKRGWKPQQVQCFIPTPGTVATAMYYAGIDTEGNSIPVARSDAERLRQHRILMPSLGSPGGAGKGRKGPPRRKGRPSSPRGRKR